MRFLVGALLIASVGCYDVPSPACGFACGPAAECPDGYACNNASESPDYRCHPTGAPLVTNPELCPPATENTPFDPRPRVNRNSLAFVQPITPTLTQFSINFTTRVIGVDGTTFRLLDDRGRAVDGEIVDATAIGGDVVMNFPLFTLEIGRAYTIVVDGNVFDARGYRLIPYSYSFAIQSDNPPLITARVPSSGESNVTVDPDLYFMLDEAVTGLDELDLVLRRGNTVIPTSFPPDGGVGKDFIYIKATKQLAPNTTYTLTALPSFFDLGGNVFAGESWMFTTGEDVVAPRVMTTPQSFDSGVSVGSALFASFDEAVSPIDNTTIQLVTIPDQISVDASITYDVADFTAIVRPTLQLAPNTSYRMRLTSSIQDGSANALPPVDVRFTTGDDFVGPRVASTSPEAESTGAPRNGPIDIAFDEVVPPPTTGDMVVTVNGVEVAGTAVQLLATSWRFVPLAPLPATTAIRVEVLVTDVHSNASFYSYEFTTGP